MAADLVIKISGDIKNFEAALEGVKSQTEGLHGGFSELGLASGAVFAAMSAEIFESVKAFGESEQATNLLTNAMQNQGIYSDELVQSYKEYAEEISKTTGIDKDKIIQTESTVQAMIGQTAVTEDLMKAITDLSAAKGMDLQSTATLISRGIDGQTTALKRLGITIDEGLTKQQRLDAITQQITLHFGGQAEQMNQGIGSIKGMNTAFDEMQKAISERFAPTIVQVIHYFTEMFNTISENPVLIDLITTIIAGTVAVSGLVLAMIAGAGAVHKISEAMTIAKEVMTALHLSTNLLVGATGLGALVLLGYEIYSNWGSIWPKMQQIYTAFVSYISELSSGLGEMLSGIFRLDTDKISEGFGHVKDTVSKGMNATVDEVKQGVTNVKDWISSMNSLPVVTVPKVHHEQDPFKLAAANKEAHERIAIETWKNQELEIQRKLMLEKEDGASTELIDIHTKEAAILKQLQDTKNKSIRASLIEHLAMYKRIEEDADDDNLEQESKFNNQVLAKNKQFQSMTENQQQAFLSTQGNKLKQSMQTEEMATQQFTMKKIQEQVQENNTFLANQQEFGTEYAAVYQAMHSAVITGTSSAFAQMQSMQSSHNEVLRTIGKAAAIAQITMSTANAAMAAIAGFSSLGPWGVPLGFAAAGAIVAYGAEQIGQVLGMAEGGLVYGGIEGKDSVPMMAMPGELVVPKQNFEEVVSSVSNKRSDSSGDGSHSADGGYAHVEISLKNNLMDFIETKLVQRKRMKLSVQGLF